MDETISSRLQLDVGSEGNALEGKVGERNIDFHTFVALGRSQSRLRKHPAVEPTDSAILSANALNSLSAAATLSKNSCDALNDVTCNATMRTHTFCAQTLRQSI